MLSRLNFAAFFACSLIMNAFSVPASRLRRRDVLDNYIEKARSDEVTRGDIDEIKTPEAGSQSLSPDITSFSEDLDTPPAAPEAVPVPVNGPIPLPEDDDDDGFEPMEASSTTGGSNLVSLLNIATSLFPGSSGNNVWMRNMIKYLIRTNLNSLNPATLGFLRRADVAENEIDLDSSNSKQINSKGSDSNESTKENSSAEESNGSENKKKSTENSEKIKESAEDNSSNKSSSEESSESRESAEDDNNAAEESIEIKTSKEKDMNSKQMSESNEGNGVNSDSDYDSDEPPGGGDGQGGGILGILAGLSGGEDGSDLGSLLATVGGIVANLSGDGFDLNSLIASGLGLFVGLLSEGNENPGGVVASYLLTSLDTITGGGSQNNGAFFGTFLSKLIKGTSAVLDENSEESGEGGEGGSDSAGFFGSLLMALLGNMSKGSSHPST